MRRTMWIEALESGHLRPIVQSASADGQPTRSAPCAFRVLLGAAIGTR